MDQQRLRVLKTNHGFKENPTRWLNYWQGKHLIHVGATAIPNCPDCGEPTHRKAVGQYVYYHTLLRLLECRACGLIWSDAAIDPQVLAGHFEQHYKDERYFQEERRPVFQQVCKLLDPLVPRGGCVLDLGGGMGHFLDLLRQSRPDIRRTLLDISVESVRYAQERFHLDAIAGTIVNVAKQRFDAVVCIDALYYEDNIRQWWQHFAQLSNVLILRVPNKINLIRARQFLFSLTHRKATRQLQDIVPSFNPEHRYILTAPYLTRRLYSMGYRTRVVAAINRSKRGYVGLAANAVAVAFRQLGLSTAMIVIAQRPAQ